jgi:hypothetical protein
MAHFKIAEAFIRNEEIRFRSYSGVSGAQHCRSLDFRAAGDLSSTGPALQNLKIIKIHLFVTELR